MGGGGKFLSTLKKAAATAGDILTTKGDLLSRSASALGRLPVSTNNFSLLCDSAQTLGIKWGASATSTLTTAGDLLYASGANTLARLARGTDNQVLTMNGSTLNWETLPAGGATLGDEESSISGADGGSMSPAANMLYVHGFTMPTTEIWYKVTGFEWYNGSGVAGNCITRLYTLNPNDAQFSLLGWGTEVACSGVDSTQRNSEVSSNVIKGGTSVVMMIGFSDTSTVLKTPAGTQVEGSLTYVISPANAMNFSWANTGTNPRMKCYFQGFS